LADMTTSYQMTHYISECDMAWDVTRTIYHHISCHLFTWGKNWRSITEETDLFEPLRSFMREPKGSSRLLLGTTLQLDQTALKSWNMLKHTAMVQSDVQGFHRAANRWRLVLIGETPEDILEQGIHLNQFVRKTHNLDLDKNQETILCQLMLHPSRYRAIRFHCGSFRLKQLSSAEVKRSLSQMLSLSYHCWRSFSHSCCSRPEGKNHGNNMK
jgi:hypothetical protein